MTYHSLARRPRLKLEKPEMDMVEIEPGYPTRGVFTVGFLLTLIGSLLLLPIQIPPTLKFVLGVGFLLVGFSVLMNSLVKARKRPTYTSAL